MKTLLGSFLSSLLILALLALLLAVLAVQDSPLVAEQAILTPADLRRARESLGAAYRAMDSGEAAILAIDEADIELALDYMLSETGGGNARSRLSPGSAHIEMSIELPSVAFGRYLNIELVLAEQDQNLLIESLQIGRLPLPTPLAQTALNLAHQELLSREPDYAALLAAVDRFQFEEGQLALEYQLPAEVLRQVSSRGRELFISPATTERLLAHAANLESLGESYSTSRRVSLTELLLPIFRFAAARSGNALEENRAAIQALAFSQLDLDLSALLLGENRSKDRPELPRITLRGRDDIAQHFLYSAALTVTTERALAESVGLLKELDDSSYGSGFSFTDLAADRAGIRFAELALRNEASARLLQQYLSQPILESDLLFDLSDLPERLDAETFRQRYTDTNSEAYQSLLREIDQRLDATPLYRTLAETNRPQ